MSKPIPIQEINPTIDDLEDWMRRRPGMKLGTARPTIMRAIRTIVEQNPKSDKTYIYNSEAIIIAIRCSASNRWCPLEGSQAVDFGDKHHKFSKSGRNPMSKKGYNAWFSAWRLFKTQKVELEEKLAKGEIDNKQFQEELGFFEQQFKDKPLRLNIGFETKEACIAYLKQEGFLD